jgi:serine/threonine-protein phosphatase PGAM5
MARTTLYLVRHAEQEPAADHAADGGLSAVGREQAHHLGRRLMRVPLSAVHHSPRARAAETADVIAHHLPEVPRHACEFVDDRTPVPSEEQRSSYPPHFLPWLDGVPEAERDVDAASLQAAVAHFGTTGEQDRHELLITHNFVIGWFVRHVLDAPTWRWMGLNLANCGLTVVQWDSDRPPMLSSFNDVGHLPPSLTAVAD